MRRYEAFLALIAELDGDEMEIRRIRPQNLRAWQRLEAGSTDPLDWGALGFTLHTLYGVVENYFLRVSKFFENNLPQVRWHKALVEKMSLDIPGLRPALFNDPQCARDAMELLRFRHRLRNLYGEDLDPGKTAEIQSIANRFYSSFPAIHADFRHKLLAIADKLKAL